MFKYFKDCTICKNIYIGKHSSNIQIKKDIAYKMTDNNFHGSFKPCCHRFMFFSIKVCDRTTVTSPAEILGVLGSKPRHRYLLVEEVGHCNPLPFWTYVVELGIWLVT